MKNKTIKTVQVFFCLFCINLFAQDESLQATVPKQSFNLSTNFAQGTVQENTGKVTTSINITNLSAKNLSYPVELSYNGAQVFKQATQLNKYSPSGVLGVGWNFGVSKIVADTKQTATRADDTFYMDGVELVCVNSYESGVLKAKFLEFETKSFSLVKIKYSQGFLAAPGFFAGGDFWEVTDADGNIYTYGRNPDSRESVLAWGNWIGNSNNPAGAIEHTTVWNLYKKEDLWGNNIKLSYEKVEQGVASWGEKHTEASYLKEIITSYGDKVVFNYNNKNYTEYYEPHIEKAEPDAYQEKYEKKYLSSIDVYTNNTILLDTHEFTYQVIANDVNNSKRYLTSYVVKNRNGESLPSQDYDYYDTGNFKGALKKVTYPSGGSIKYNYDKKYLFFNNYKNSSVSIPTDYKYVNSVVRDNYTLDICITEPGRDGGDVNVFIRRSWWTGSKWKSHGFYLPHKTHYYRGFNEMNITFQDDFYVIASKIDKDHQNMYFFALEDSRRIWNYKEFNDMHIGAKDGVNATLLSTEDFVLSGAYYDNELRLFTWDGLSWLKEEVDTDDLVKKKFSVSNNLFTQVINGSPDSYNCWYLDNEKEWNYVDWTDNMKSFFDDYKGIGNTSNISVGQGKGLYLLNNNPEIIFNWDINYKIDETYNFQASKDSYNVSHINPEFSAVYSHEGIEKLFGFNGVSFSEFSTTESSVSNTYGPGLYKYNTGSNFVFNPNTIFYQNNIYHSGNSFREKLNYYYKYNPNTNSFSGENITNSGINGSLFFVVTNAVTNSFAISHDEVYKIDRYGNYNYDFKLNLSAPNMAVGGNRYVIVQNGFKTSYNRNFMISENYNTGDIEEKDLGYKKLMVGGRHEFGGHESVLSSKSIYFYESNIPKLYRLIDQDFSNHIYENVLESVELNDGNGNTYTTEYEYFDDSPTPDNSITYFEKVKSAVSASNGSTGYVEKYYNGGQYDLRRAGELKEVKYFNDSDEELKSIKYSYQTKTSVIENSFFKDVNISFFKANNNTITEIAETGSVNRVYNNNNYNYFTGQLESTYKHDIYGDRKSTEITYAYKTNDIMEEKNMLNAHKKIINKADLFDVTSCTVLDWSTHNGIPYVDKSSSGVDESNLRVSFDVQKITDLGHVVSVKDGVGVINNTILAYNYKYPIAEISNVSYDEIFNQLGYTEIEIQSLSSNVLKSAFKNLYNTLPESVITLSFYNDEGQLIEAVDARGESMYYYYDSFGRIDYVTDSNNNVLNKKQYHYSKD